jgi:hypothetical protein
MVDTGKDNTDVEAGPDDAALQPQGLTRRRRRASGGMVYWETKKKDGLYLLLSRILSGGVSLDCLVPLTKEGYYSSCEFKQ